MTQNSTLLHAKDLFIVLKLFVENLATNEEVEALAACVEPLNNAICKRIGAPPDKKLN